MSPQSRKKSIQEHNETLCELSCTTVTESGSDCEIETMTVGWQLVIYAVVLCLVVESRGTTDEEGTLPIYGSPEPFEAKQQLRRSVNAKPSGIEHPAQHKDSNPLLSKLTSRLKSKEEKCCASHALMYGKTVLVTGSNTGIGYQTAKDIFDRGARIIMACRNLEAAFAAKRRIIKELGLEYEECEQEIIVVQLDLSSLEVIRDFNIRLRERGIKKLDVLIHNAGVGLPFSGKTTYEGFEYTMATNYYGPYLLTHLLIDLLRKAGNVEEPARIVVVASLLHNFSTLNVKSLKPMWNPLLPALSYYCDSKHADILFAVELSRRLRFDHVTVNALHPGLISSDIFRHVPVILKPFVLGFVKTFLMNTKQGAQTTICCAVDPALKEKSGLYFDDCKEKKCFKIFVTKEKAETLWKTTAEYINLTDEERKALPEAPQISMKFGSEEGDNWD